MDNFTGMDKNTGIRDWLAQISYVILSKSLSFCILIFII